MHLRYPFGQPLSVRRLRVKYPIESFELVPCTDLGPSHFARNPLWSEYYDFEERCEIEAWGVSREWLDTALEAMPSHPHPAYPVLVHKPFPVRMRVFIGAKFTTAAGQQIDGYIVNPDAVAVCLFLNGEEFVFSRSSNSRELSAVERIRGLLSGRDDPVFPLSYLSDVQREDGSRFQGHWMPDWAAV